jgi:hypothetical protein
MNKTSVDLVAPLMVGAFGAALLLLCADAAQADVISAAWSSNTQYIYEINHMPDLDQRREGGPGIVGLPGDGGMYCVPTSVMNLFAYAANHGFEQVAPGPGWWQLQSRYNDAGTAIALLGAFMGTDPNDGTNGNGTIFGSELWLNANGGILSADYNYASGSYSPTINSLAWSAVNGGIVAFCYGRYQVIDGSADTVFVGSRVGGHMVTLAKAARSGSSMIIASRDPADDPDSDDPNHKQTQSLFGNNVYNVSNVNAISVNPLWARTMTALNWDPDNNDGKIRLIDSYLVVKPKWGLTFVNTGGPDSILTILLPNGWFADPPHLQFEWGQNSALLDALLSPDSDVFFAISHVIGVPNRIQRYNLDTQEVTDIATLPDATHLILGRKRQLYILAGDRMHCLDPDDEDPEIITIMPPIAIVALAFDDRTDRVIALSTARNSLLSYEESLQGDPMLYELPGEVELGGAGTVAVSPLDGRIWMASEANDTLYGFMPDARNGEPPLVLVLDDQIRNPTDLSVDDVNHVFVATEGRIVELERISDTEWRPVEDSAFADLEIGTDFQIAHSRTNFDPEEHTSPDWNNVDPDDLTRLGTYYADCPGDTNDDRKVDTSDLLYLLAAWGLDDPLADIAPPGVGDDIVDAQDLLQLLAAWGPCE